MKSFAALIVALFAALSLVVAAPSQAALEARSQKVKEIRALRSYVDLAARDREHRGPPAGRGPPANRGPPGPPGPPANRGPPGPAGKGDRGHHYGEGNGNGNHGKNLATDPNNCGAPFFVCPESYNGLGDRVCDFGKCKLNCPPGLQHTVHAFFPEISFCA